MRATILLADSAQAVEGKLYILGGGWTVHALGSPTAVALYIQVPWDMTNREHRWILELLDGDGQPVEIQAPIGNQPVRLEGQFEVGRPPGVAAGSELGVAVAINLGPLPLEPGGRYVWRLSINDQTNDNWRQPFSVAPLAPGQPPPSDCARREQ